VCLSLIRCSIAAPRHLGLDSFDAPAAPRPLLCDYVVPPPSLPCLEFESECFFRGSGEAIGYLCLDERGVCVCVCVCLLHP
ncbi:hypothetical protein LZ30DRAFT_735994, partial [Colletotrichum cereale]